MKIRNGFVSNSSSSSFVLIGTKIKGNDLNFEEVIKMQENWEDDIIKYVNSSRYYRERLEKEHNGDIHKYLKEDEDLLFDYFYSTNDSGFGEGKLDMIYDDYDMYIGKCLVDSEYFEGIEVDEDLTETMKDIKERLDNIGLDSKIKLYAGQRPC